MTRRSLAITLAVIATGLVAWTKSASLLDKCRKLRRGGFSTSSRSDIGHVPPPPLSPAQLERARAAMEELYGDCCLLGRKL